MYVFSSFHHVNFVRSFIVTSIILNSACELVAVFCPGEKYIALCVKTYMAVMSYPVSKSIRMFCACVGDLVIFSVLLDFFISFALVLNRSEFCTI